MGIWGPGIFDNDYTLDWLLDLEKTSVVGLIEDAFASMRMDGGAEQLAALAGAELVAAAWGVPRKHLDPTDPTHSPETVAWIGRERRYFTPALLAKAQQTVAEILEHPLIWRSAQRGWRPPELGLAWYAGIENLAHRLASVHPSQLRLL